MKNLISMVAFILQDNGIHQVVSYAKFLFQKLELWMFVPCKLVDGVWVVLEEPKEIPCAECLDHHSLTCDFCKEELKEYQQAKERCLFEGFEYKKELKNSGGNYTHFLENKDIQIYIQWGGFHLFGKYDLKTIEDLVKYNIELTPTAQKQIGL